MGRYEAVAVSLPGPTNGGQHPGGQVWMTGGREGSNILMKNEVLQYPAIFSNIGASPGYELKRWQWSNEKAKQSEVILYFRNCFNQLLFILLDMELWCEVLDV